MEAFTEHINTVDSNVKFTQENVGGNSLDFLEYEVQIGDDRILNIAVYRKLHHKDQYFDPHHPLESKLGVIRTLHHRAQKVPTRKEVKKKIKNAICGFPNWCLSQPNRDKRQTEQKRMIN